MTVPFIGLLRADVALTVLALLGLQEIAVSMSDPFGRDYDDFDTEQICLNAYGNAVEYLRERDVKMRTFEELEKNEASIARNPLLVKRSTGLDRLSTSSPTPMSA